MKKKITNQKNFKNLSNSFHKQKKRSNQIIKYFYIYKTYILLKNSDMIKIILLL